MKPLFPAVWRIVESSLFNTNGTLFKIALPLVAQQLLKLLLVNSRNEIRNMILFTFADFLFLVSAFCGVFRVRLPLTIIIFPLNFTAQIINFIIGALVVIKRSLLIIGGLLLTFWRLDLDWISIDSGHAAYCAMIVIDCAFDYCSFTSFMRVIL